MARRPERARDNIGLFCPTLLPKRPWEGPSYSDLGVLRRTITAYQRPVVDPSVVRRCSPRFFCPVASVPEKRGKPHNTDGPVFRRWTYVVDCNLPVITTQELQDL